MELDGVMLSEISQTEKDKIPYGLTYMWNLKKKKEKKKRKNQTHRYREHIGACNVQNDEYSS